MQRSHFIGFALVAVIFYLVGAAWPNYGQMVVNKVKAIIPS
jgi:hypothetical protein